MICSARGITTCTTIAALLLAMACTGDDRLSPEIDGHDGGPASSHGHSSPPPPPPPEETQTPSLSGRTYFVADAESGGLGAWSLPWGVVQFNGTVSTSTVRSVTGSRSYRYEVTRSGQPSSGAVGHDVRTMSGNPQVSMGSPNGRYRSGYYSFWAYVDEGYDQAGWNLLIGWMTGVTGRPSPISNIGLEYRNGVLQLMFQLKNAAVGRYTAPTIPGYTMQANGWYYMSQQSPAGIKPFPRKRWVHVGVNYKMASSNGRVTIWQDGVKVMDLTAPTMNTFMGNESGSNTAGDMMLQFGIYGGPVSRLQRLYVDDFKVNDLQ